MIWDCGTRLGDVPGVRDVYNKAEGELYGMQDLEEDMANTVVRLFDEMEDARNAVEALHQAGFADDQISVVASDYRGEYARYLEGQEEDEGVSEGAGVGALVGGMTGLLIGLGAVALPGVGPIIAAGPLLAALTGGALGTVTGALAGALVDLGMPEDRAGYYTEAVRRGGVLVLVHTDEAKAPLALRAMDRYKSVDVEERAAHWQESGWEGYDPDAEPYVPDEIDRMRARTGS